MTNIMENGSRIAVIGGGIAGLTAAYLLQKKHHVTLFEKENYIGGHAKTVVIEDGVDAGTPLDIGLQVFNRKSYPCFIKLLGEVPDVKYKTSNVSWSYFSRLDGFHYQLKFPPIKKSLPQDPIAESQLEFRPQPTRVAQLYKELWKFKKIANRQIASNSPSLKQPLGDYLKENDFSKDFIECYALACGAGIWSMISTKVLAFPAEAFISYLENHGFLDIKNFREWLYIEGGSRKYVQAILQKMRGKIETQMPVQKVIRTSNGAVPAKLLIIGRMCLPHPVTPNILAQLGNH
ncbi:MAG: FAD-dependent oxidoreductase [Hormoscilla sp. GUM202]|nr:FAD-dependent oxidoreductase [Hormoscilla sp. GUM202]